MSYSLAPQPHVLLYELPRRTRPFGPLLDAIVPRNIESSKSSQFTVAIPQSYRAILESSILIPSQLLRPPSNLKSCLKANTLKALLHVLFSIPLFSLEPCSHWTETMSNAFPIQLSPTPNHNYRTWFLIWSFTSWTKFLPNKISCSVLQQPNQVPTKQDFLFGPSLAEPSSYQTGFPIWSFISWTKLLSNRISCLILRQPNQVPIE